MQGIGGTLSLASDGLCASADSHTSVWLHPLWWRPPTPGLYITSDPSVLAVTLAAAAGVFLADRSVLDSTATA